jgi:hypothetical protein
MKLVDRWRGSSPYPRGLPMANSEPSLRRKICPFEIAGEAISRSPRCAR